MDVEKLKCTRQCLLTLKCKNQLPPLDHPNWWARLFELLDKEAHIPPEHRHNVIHDIFPKKILKKIMSMLNIEENECHKKCKCNLPFLPPSPQNSLDFKLRRRADSRFESNRSIFEIEEIGKEYRLTEHDHEVGARNPYTSFFQRPPEEAAIWRPIQVDQSISLNEKARIVTERIAIDFINWMKEFKEQEFILNRESITKLFTNAFSAATRSTERRNTRKSIAISSARMQKAREEARLRREAAQREDFDTEGVMKMFGIGSNFDAARSLTIAVKEIACVTERIAYANRVPEMGRRRRFYTNLRKDIKNSQKKPKPIAFGRCLPNELKYKVPQLTYTQKYELQLRQRETAILKRLFNSISHLTSAQNYCDWLVNHSEVIPPKRVLENYAHYMKTCDRYHSINTKLPQEACEEDSCATHDISMLSQMTAHSYREQLAVHLNK